MSIEVGFGFVGVLLSGILGTNIWLVWKVSTIDSRQRRCRYCARSEAEDRTGLDLRAQNE